MTGSPREIVAALNAFPGSDLAEGGRAILRALGFSSRRTLDVGSSADDFRAVFDHKHLLNADRACLKKWKSWAFLFQLTNQEIPPLARGAETSSAASPDKGQVESMVFLAVDLEPWGEGAWPRGKLADITRQINRCTAMPAIVLFRAGAIASLAVISRRRSLRDPEHDVLGSKVAIIRDVDCARPHRGQVQILEDLAKTREEGAGGFEPLYSAWLKALEVETLNQIFYRRLAGWFLWAREVVKFPPGQPKDEGKQSLAVIRLLTRLMFVWFLREKGLVPDDFFDVASLAKLLRKGPTADPDGSGYYKAILQNLFFATLNTDAKERGWRGSGPAKYFDPRLWRHRDLLGNPAEVEKLLCAVPFLNGGLFDCLDRDLSDRDFERDPDLRKRACKEGNGWILRVDAFTSRKDVKLNVPNQIFFAEQLECDLAEELGTRQKTVVEGLVPLLDSFKFTVEENTPLDQDVALDPELLGLVFENLLASYNPDTKQQARKQTGSFYTPREVVGFMVVESLVAYFQRRMGWEGDAKREAQLRELLDWKAKDKPIFSPEEARGLVAAIEGLRAIDPACGSGAFPMGLLEHLLLALRHLDPGNDLWREQNRARLVKVLDDAQTIPIHETRDAQVADATEALARFDRDFADPARLEYTRKLHLVENCIYGVDIQPIAVQIAKLRLFISLVVAQRVNHGEKNHGVIPLPNLEMRLVAADSLRGLEEEGHKPTLRSDSVLAAERALRQASSRYYSAGSISAKRRLRSDIERLRTGLLRLLRTGALLSNGEAKILARWDPFDQNTHAEFFDPEWMFQLQRGFDLVIGNPPYVRQEAIRKEDKSQYALHYDCASGTADLYVYFYERGVRLLRQDGGVLAYISSNKWLRSGYGKKLRAWLPRQTKMLWAIDFGDQDVFKATAYPGIFLVQRRPPAGYAEASAGDGNVRVYNWPAGLSFGPESFPSAPLRDFFTMPQSDLAQSDGWHLEVAGKRDLLARLRNSGTPLNEFCGGRIYRGVLTGLNEAFVIDGAERERLIAEDPRSAEIIKPFLVGRDIKRWRAQPRDRWLIKIESSENRRHPWSEGRATAERSFRREFPAVATRLGQFCDELGERADKGRFPWELRSCDYWSEFEKPKIVYPDISVGPCYAWDASGSLLANTAYMICGVGVWVCAILNSPPVEWYLTSSASAIRGGYRRAIFLYVGKLPMPVAGAQEQAVLSALSKVLSTGGPDPRLEQLTNALAYELFFPEELHARSLDFAGELAASGVERMAGAKGREASDAAAALSRRCANPDDRLGRMLLDLQSIEVVRIIEDPAGGHEN